MIPVGVHRSALKHGAKVEDVIRMWAQAIDHRADPGEAEMTKHAEPEDGSYGSIDGVEITEEVIDRLVKNAEAGFPGASFRSPGRPARSYAPTKAITVRLTEDELAAVMARAERENRSRSDAIRAALAEWASAA